MANEKLLKETDSITAFVDNIHAIKKQLDAKYKDGTVYDSRELAMKAATEYQGEVQTKLSGILRTLSNEHTIATDFPCLRYVRVWSNGATPQLFNKNFRYRPDELSFMADSLLQEWFEKELKEREEMKECGL